MRRRKQDAGSPRFASGSLQPKVEPLIPEQAYYVRPARTIKLFGILTRVRRQNCVFVLRTVGHVAVMHDTAVVVRNAIIASSFHFVEVEFPGWKSSRIKNSQDTGLLP